MHPNEMHLAGSPQYAGPEASQGFVQVHLGVAAPAGAPGCRKHLEGGFGFCFSLGAQGVAQCQG